MNLTAALGTGDVLTIINQFLLLLGGVAAFIIGMNVMGHNLEKAAGRSMRKLMTKATKNRFVGVGTGAAVTAIVTSSSATTVLIVGFVNVGIMTLVQAASVIMGANIGTTITAFITALSTTGGNLAITSIFAFLAFVGVLMSMLAKRNTVKQVGAILQGLGLIFIGMNTISTSMGVLLKGDTPIAGAIRDAFTAIGYGKTTLTWEIPVLFILGAALTGLVQSSAAITAIAISLASANVLSLPMAMFIILGTNVGTCVTALLSSLGASVNAKRTAIVHLLFNIIGSIIFIIPLSFSAVSNGIAGLLNSTGLELSWQIALFHMVFNVLTTCFLLPFQKQLVKLSTLLVRDRKQPQTPDDETLDMRLLKTPAIAVGQARKQIVRMGSEAFANYKRSLDMLLSGDFSAKPDFDATEENINKLNKYITGFLVKLSLEAISEIDEKKVSSFYHVTSDIERIGDYAQNIVEYAVKIKDNKYEFSDSAVEEIRQMDSHLTELYKYVELTFANLDLSYIPNVEEEEKATDDMNIRMQQSHLRRVNEGRCNAELGALFLQLALNMERIGDHMRNIANSVREYGHYHEVKNAAGAANS